jgi:very-short-patch-repair endonuclease
LHPDYLLTFDSPVERMFWDAHRDALLKPLAGLMPQVAHGRYRIDFAVEKTQFGIEIDGLAWHNQDSFIRDRNRQRALEKDGWRIARFAAKEVMDDAAKCVHEAAEQAAALVSA